VVGLVGDAAIIQNFGWQATFLAILPAAIVLWLIIARFMRIGSPTSKASTTIDIKGTLALAATIITFLAAITLIEDNSYGEMYQVAGLFAASGVSLAAFQVNDEQDFPGSNDYSNAGLYVYFHGIPNYSCHGKKSSSIWIRRQCNNSCRCLATLYDRIIDWNNHVRLYLE
jgi:hypothetical protein